MSSELEEVVMSSDFVDPKEFLPDGGQGFFDGAFRRFVNGLGKGMVIGAGERFAVELAIGCEGQAVERDIGCRHHVVGQGLLEMAAQVFGRDVLIAEVIGDELLIPSLGLSGDDHGILDRFMFAECGLDFTELNTEAPDLHLEVIASEELDIAVRQPASEIACFVHTGVWFITEGIGNETFGR